jgi:hypothetical protein
MTELALPARGGRRFKGAPGTEKQVGRNNPHIGVWLIRELAGIAPHRRIADPMCGAGQLWLNALQEDPSVVIYGCDIAPERVQLARLNGIVAEDGWAQEWTPPGAVDVDLIAFSPIYPNCDHDSGANERQQELIKKKGLHAMQRIEGTRNLLPVFLHLQTYRHRAPVAVIARNAIEKQVEVDWVSENPRHRVIKHEWILVGGRG